MLALKKVCPCSNSCKEPHLENFPHTFEDVIKYLEVRLSRVKWVALKFNACVLIRDIQRRRQRRHCEDGSRDRSHVTIAKGALNEVVCPADTLILNFRTPEL